MTMRSWIHRLFTRPAPRAIRKSPPRFRPLLEALEDRCVPSTFTVINTLDDGSVGSLRWAVGQANLNVGNDTINFDSTVFSTPQTIPLAGTQLELSDKSGNAWSGRGRRDARTIMAGQDCLPVGLAESRESPSGVDGCTRRQSSEPVAVDGRRQSNKLGKRLDKNPEKDARAGGGGGFTIQRVFRK